MTHYFESARNAISEAFMIYSSVFYRNKKVDFLALNKDGTLLVRNVEGKVENVLDGEKLN